MTWFGIFLLIYYILNILAGVYYLVKGGYKGGTEALSINLVISIFLIICLVTVGTNR